VHLHLGREVRRVPAGWDHPKDDKGRFIPLHGGSFAKADAEWTEGWQKWQQGLRDDWSGGWKPVDPEYRTVRFTDYHGSRPSPDDYMPDWPEDQRTRLMMYEDTSEGTPISPAFETPEELARWLADTGASAFGGMTADYEHWLGIARGGWAPSMVIDNGRMMSGVEAMGASK
jgi:hypothetical protein